MTSDIERLAAQAAPYAHFTGYDPKAGLRRIAAKVAARKAAAAGVGESDRAPAAPATGAARQAFHAQAEQDLRNLATLLINETAGPELIQRLVDITETINPAQQLLIDVDADGATIFAALLYLADHPRNAQFWFQFAAGSGDGTAAYCLYLHHIALGELRAAEHWFHQAGLLQDAPAPCHPRPSVPPLDLYLLHTPLHGHGLVPADTRTLQHPDPALRRAVDDLRPVREADEFGAFVVPTETIAEQLHELVSH
ncbi:hypothetical protein ACFW1A_00930 [Kitasatospora sp. NPDC058965]|uniref:hypothetical protein n=1 Tax=Kitasatospora sp. NPDC058965 TaxID=3346682 RepID=UPI0036CF7E2D